MFVVGAGGQAGQQALGVQLRPHIAKYLVALVDGASQRDLLRSGNAALLQRHGSVSTFDGGPLHGSFTQNIGAVDGWSAPPTGVSTGNLTDFVLLWVHGHNATSYEYGCGTYGMTVNGSEGCGITTRHGGIGFHWGAFDLGASGNLADSGEILPAGLQMLVHVRNGSTHRLYRNGALVATVAGGNGNANPNARWGHGNLGAGETFSAPSKVFALSGRFARDLTHDEVVDLSADPRGFLFDDAAPLAEVWLGTAGVWNVVLAEMYAGADTATPSGTFGAPATDTLTVADTLATLTSQLAARLDALAASDTHTAGLSGSAAEADTLVASDALNAGLSGSAARTDAVSLADVFSSVSSVAGQTGEVASLAEAITGQILATAAALSSVTLGDTLATALAAAVAALETSTPTDSPVADPLNAASSVEAFLGADAAQAVLLGGAQAAEVVSAAELVATAMVALAYALDAATPTDALGSALSGLAALTEGTTPADASVTATASTYTMSLQEAVAALDALAASLNDVFRTYPLAGEAQTFALGAAIQTWVLENLQQPYPLNPSE